jgi:putative transposase
MMESNVTCSHSCPRVRNDNPFSESQFKTQKYQPDYPGRFNDIHHARLWTEEYVTWYNTEHHHSGLACFTPEQVCTGQYHKIAQAKQLALDSGYQNPPESFVKGRPIVPMPPRTVAINPITPSYDGEYVGDRVNFPTLTAAGYVK